MLVLALVREGGGITLLMGQSPIRSLGSHRGHRDVLMIGMGSLTKSRESPNESDQTAKPNYLERHTR